MNWQELHGRKWVLWTMARVREATGHEPTWEIEGNEVVRLVRPREA